MMNDDTIRRSIEAKERRACWEDINLHIVSGRLTGNGCDELAYRNGMIYASNLIMERINRLGDM